MNGATMRAEVRKSTPLRENPSAREELREYWLDVLIVLAECSR